MKKEHKSIFNFEIHTKKAKMEKKKAHFFGIFCFFTTCAFFWIFNLNIHEKRQKFKKAKIKFSNSKNICAKKGRK